MKTLLILVFLCATLMPAAAFMPTDHGKETKSCIDCHDLSTAEANKILKQIDGEVLSVTDAEVLGLWRVNMKMNGKIWPLYLDYAKTHLISGNVIQLETRENLTQSHYRELNPVDITTIPLDDALLMGDPQAKTQVVVFTDPHCPYCSKLHQEIKKALEVRPDIAWQIKLLPFKKGSREAVETILCEKSTKKSLELLDAAFNGRQLPPASCKNSSIDPTLKIAQDMGVRSTPTLVLPNGQIIPGYKELDPLLQLVDENTPAPSSAPATAE